MPFAVELLLNDPLRDTVCSARELLRSSGIPGLECDGKFNPHITLGYFHDMDETVIQSTLHQVSQQVVAVRFTLSHIGIFPKSDEYVLFIGVASKQEIYEAQELVHKRFLAHTQSADQFCLPENFVPHVTLMENLRAKDLEKALSVLKAEDILRFPLHGLAQDLCIDYGEGRLSVLPLRTREVIASDFGRSHGREVAR